MNQRTIAFGMAVIHASGRQKESSMGLPHRLTWSLMLLVSLNGRPALADDSPGPPDQYAEVVLRVEGMI